MIYAWLNKNNGKKERERERERESPPVIIMADELQEFEPIQSRALSCRRHCYVVSIDIRNLATLSRSTNRLLT